MKKVRVINILTFQHPISGLSGELDFGFAYNVNVLIASRYEAGHEQLECIVSFFK